MWFISSLGPNVTLQAARPGVSFVTLFAGMWFPLSVDSNVPIQGARLGESFVTFHAIMWFLPSMDSNMFLQPTSIRKVWLHSLHKCGFSPVWIILIVINQVARLIESLVTFHAGMWFLSSVDPNVPH